MFIWCKAFSYTHTPSWLLIFMPCDLVLWCDSINSTHCYYFGTVYSIAAMQAMNININGGMLFIITTLRGPLKTDKLPSCWIHTLFNNHMCTHTHTCIFVCLTPISCQFSYVLEVCWWDVSNIIITIPRAREREREKKRKIGEMISKSLGPIRSLLWPSRPCGTNGPLLAKISKLKSQY